MRIVVASSGPYDFLGSKHFREAEGHRFDRLRVVQDGKTFGFVQDDYKWTSPFTEGIKGQQDAALFALHECGHAAVAHALGLRVYSVELSAVGGFCRLQMTRRPRDTGLVYSAGLAVQILLLLLTPIYRAEKFETI